MLGAVLLFAALLCTILDVGLLLLCIHYVTCAHTHTDLYSLAIGLLSCVVCARSSFGRGAGGMAGWEGRLVSKRFDQTKLTTSSKTFRKSPSNTLDGTRCKLIRHIPVRTRQIESEEIGI